MTRIWVKIVFGLILAVLIVAFVNVGVSLVYERPDFEDFCDINAPRLFEEPNKLEIQEQDECRKEYSEASESYSRNIFVVLSIIGFALIIIGLFVQVLTLQIMLLASGAVNVIIGVFRNLQDKLLVFITIGVLIMIGIYLVVKKVERK